MRGIMDIYVTLDIYIEYYFSLRLTLVLTLSHDILSLMALSYNQIMHILKCIVALNLYGYLVKTQILN